MNRHRSSHGVTGVAALISAGFSVGVWPPANTALTDNPPTSSWLAKTSFQRHVSQVHIRRNSPSKTP